jgi:hypothetical protein
MSKFGCVPVEVTSGFIHIVMYVGAPGGVQDCTAARVRSGAASGHQLQDGGAVHHCRRQAVQAGPQKDLPLNFFCDF